MTTYEPEARTTPKGRSYRKVIDRATIAVSGPGYDLERSAFGIEDVGVFADRVHRRHEAINATFDKARAIVESSTHSANVPTYLAKLEAVKALWHVKGSRWKANRKAADYATRKNVMYLTEEGTAEIRRLLLNPPYGGDKWAFLPKQRKPRKPQRVGGLPLPLYGLQMDD